MTRSFKSNIEAKNPPQPPMKKREEMEEFWKWVKVHIDHVGESDNWYEKFILSSSSLEQRMLPALIKFVAEHHGVNLPGDIFDRGNNAYNINLLYYSLSHDKQLYDLLEGARKKRNDVVHKFYKGKKAINNNASLKAATISCFEAIAQIIERFAPGHNKIPSLTLYSRGWNDCREKMLEAANRVIEDIKQGKA